MSSNLTGRDYARIALGLIRLFNGVAALFVPSWLIRRLGVDPNNSPATPYAFRLFGIRTVLIGADLLLGDRESHARALRPAILIHASDTLTAILAGVTGQLSRRAAITTTIISAINTLLAVIAQPRRT